MITDSRRSVPSTFYAEDQSEYTSAIEKLWRGESGTVTSPLAPHEKLLYLHRKANDEQRRGIAPPSRQQPGQRELRAYIYGPASAGDPGQASPQQLDSLSQYVPSSSFLLSALCPPHPIFFCS